MSVMNSTKLSAQIKSIRGNTAKLREQIQEVLISCAYYAVKDGDVGAFNRLLDAVGTATRVKGLTLWAETWGFVRVKNEAFVLNKAARNEQGAVLNESDFAPMEEMMRAAPKWYEMVPKEKVASMFDAGVYLTHVIEKLGKEGQSDVAKYIEAAVEQYNKDMAIKELALSDALV